MSAECSRLASGRALHLSNTGGFRLPPSAIDVSDVLRNVVQTTEELARLCRTRPNCPLYLALHMCFCTRSQRWSSTSRSNGMLDMSHSVSVVQSSATSSRFAYQAGNSCECRLRKYRSFPSWLACHSGCHFHLGRARIQHCPHHAARLCDLYHPIALTNSNIREYAYHVGGISRVPAWHS